MKSVSGLVQFTCVLLLLFGYVVTVNSGISIQINNANVDQTSERLSLHGVNFDAFGPTSVTIGDILLSSCTATPVLIECPLTGTPVLALGGNWRVSVSAGNSPHANASIDVYVSAQTTAIQCFSGDVLECYSGDPATRDVSGCQPGIRTCQPDGTWSTCQGEVIPEAQRCGVDSDDDCDGLFNYADPDCTQACADLGGTVCDTECVDINTDPANCGTCGSQCGVDEACVAGSCALSCTAPEIACAGECINPYTDPANCGACGQQCGVNQACVAGSCAVSCPPPTTECGGTCVDLTSDSNNCGACGQQCGVNQACVAGSCALSCAPPTTECAGACVDLSYDPNNCGTCGQACGTGQSCVSGACL